MTPDALIHNIAARQGGIVLTDQAIECGFTPSMIRYRVRTRGWEPAGTRVYRLFEMNAPRDLLQAAVIALPGAVVSHESAASFHSIPMVQTARPIVTVHTRTTHTFPGTKVHRSHDLLARHVTSVDGLPSTTLPRTVVDLAAILSRRHLALVVDDLLAARRLAVNDLQEVHSDVARKGKPGSAALRAILEERTEAGAHPGSRMETIGLALLVDAGLPSPAVEHPMPWQTNRRFDLAYPACQLAIEWDSRRWHTQVEAFERDRKRDRLAVLNGWRVLRFTWVDLSERPQDVVQTVRQALEADDHRRSTTTVGRSAP